MTPRRLVVSAVNFSEGGPLTVLIDCLEAAAATLGDEWEITALVHDVRLIRNPRINSIAYPQSKQSWLNRLRLEWWEFHRLSREVKPDLWLSLHDITPRVAARRQAVYCHNPSPFYQPNMTEAWFDPSFLLFNKLYMQLYKLRIRQNHAVIVQQVWLRDAFFRATRHPQIIVAHPGSAAELTAPDGVSPVVLVRRPTPQAPLRLLYPSLPRVFKNMEVLYEAIERLPEDLRRLIDVRLTLDGSENRWAAELTRRYQGLHGVTLLGRLDRSGMTAEYETCDAVLFPSRLETWGLPITEAKAFGKPLLAADLPYAKETVGTYRNVAFVPVNDAAAWADQFAAMARGTWKPQGHTAKAPQQPFAPDWPSLWRFLVDGL